MRRVKLLLLVAFSVLLISCSSSDDSSDSPSNLGTLGGTTDVVVAEVVEAVTLSVWGTVYPPSSYEIDLIGTLNNATGDQVYSNELVITNTYDSSVVITLTDFVDNATNNEFTITNVSTGDIITSDMYDLSANSTVTFVVAYQVGGGITATTTPSISFSSTDNSTSNDTTVTFKGADNRSVNLKIGGTSVTTNPYYVGLVTGSLTSDSITLTNDSFTDNATIQLTGFADNATDNEFIIMDNSTSTIITADTYNLPANSSVTFVVTYQVGSGGIANSIPSISYGSNALGMGSTYVYFKGADNSTDLAGYTTATDGTWQIANAYGLRSFVSQVSDNSSTDAILTDNITLISDWTPISTYSGTFDGDNYTISGLDITCSSYYAGLFGQVSSGVIKNLTISSPSIDVDMTYTSSFVGALAGYVSSSVIYNVTVTGGIIKANANGNIYGGGVVGYSNNSVMKGVSTQGSATVTGIAGATAYMGGVIGQIINSSSIQNTYAKDSVKVQSTGNTAVSGGIAGYFTSSSITASYVIDNVTTTAIGSSDNYSSGIIGMTGSSSDITACYVDNGNNDVVDYIGTDITVTNSYYISSAAIGTDTTGETMLSDIAALNAVVSDMNTAITAYNTTALTTVTYEYAEGSDTSTDLPTVSSTTD